MDRVRTALLSAYDKTGLGQFAAGLCRLGFELIGSRGTAQFLNEGGTKTRDIAEIVGPPILGHRVVTLSREIFAGILATNSPEDEAELKRIGAPRIDLVYVDLYPLQKEMEREGATKKSMLEMIDIGGPSLLRAAGKGQRVVVSSPSQMGTILDFLRNESEKSQEEKQEFLSLLAAEAEEVISRYCHTAAMCHITKED